MLRTDKPIYKAILILNLLLIIAGVILSVKGITSKDASVIRIIMSVVAIVCIVFAAFFIFGGYTKNSAKYYDIYGTLLVIKHLAGILSGRTNSSTTFEIIVLALSLVITLVILLNENLGKEKSLVLCGLLVALSIVLLVYSLNEDNIQTFSIMNSIVNIDLVCLYGIMTYAKYLDKTERGTR